MSRPEPRSHHDGVTGTGFRRHLKQATDAHHQRVDQRFDQLDLHSNADRRIFLHSHALALSNVAPFLDRAHEVSGPVSFLPRVWSEQVRLLEADLRQDLAVSGDNPAVFDLPLDASHHVLGITYVIAGSRLGGQVLAKRFAAKQSGARVPHYLTRPLPQGAWRQLCDHLDSIVDGEIQDQVVCSAMYMFDRFEGAVTRTKQDERGNIYRQ